MLPRRIQKRGKERSLAGSALGTWALELCLGKETAGTSKVFEKILIIASTDISLFWKNSLGNTLKHNGSAKNCFSRGKTSVFSRLFSESEERKR